MAVVEAVGLRKVYPAGKIVALDGVSFTVNPGEAVAVIGPSGAGKTTLFRVLNRSISLDAGRVRIDGIDLFETGYFALKNLRCGIGVVYQQHNLVVELGVLANVMMGRLGRWPTLKALRSLLTGPDAETIDDVTAALDRVGLGEKICCRVSDLSGGEQQRVAIARLLVQNPDLVLADEPVASVDPASAEKIMDMFRELRRAGKTLIVNVHDVTLASRFFERVMAIRDGKLIFDGKPGELTPAALDEIYARNGECTCEEPTIPETMCLERLARES